MTPLLVTLEASLSVLSVTSDSKDVVGLKIWNSAAHTTDRGYRVSLQSYLHCARGGSIARCVGAAMLDLERPRA